MSDYILVIDHGTQSVRALLFDARGTLAAKSRVPVSYLSPEPGWAEQDPGVLWGAVAEACRRLWAESPVPKDAVRGVTLTTQRGTVVNVDEGGRPLRPAITWMDRRRTEGLPPVGGLWGALFSLSGMSGTVGFFQAEAEANWIARHEPELWRRTHRYLLLSGFLTHRLTGRFVDSVGAQVGYLPFDFKGLRWAAPSDWKWRIAPFDRAKLPELVPPGAPLGEVTRAAAAATGIPAGLPVIAGAADKACEVLGSGALEPNVGCLSYSTIATVNTTQRRYVEPIPLIPPYPAAVPGAYSLEVQVARGYWMVTWFKEEFGHPERARAVALGVEPEALFDELVREVPPGSSGLMLQPYWSPGVKVPGPEARGTVIGFRDGHRRPHLYRAILEGLAYALREAAERIARRSGTRITELRVAGGGSQSDAAMQITADVFGLPAARPHVYEASGLGAAIDAAVGLGLHPDFESAVRAMTRPGRVFEPNGAAGAVYERLYREVYLAMYPRVRPLYRRIREIIGG
ncbi:MAG TPA: FGGY-family carbohydrate kinase [Gemmatimonadaceae bacterium]|nr:FGGY-family carbohydrate kinase [Gemmatimonadaceae bacterium]